MNKKFNVIAGILCISLSLGCRTFSGLSSVDATHTSVPTASPIPACEPVSALADARKAYPENTTFLYTLEEEIKVLVVWFVDPKIELDPTASRREYNAFVASDHARVFLSELVEKVPCVKYGFDWVRVINVDRRNNLWFGADARTSTIPPRKTMQSERKIEFSYWYVREKLPPTLDAESPEDACTWEQARQALDGALEPSMVNSGYFVMIRKDVEVWAQWDGFTGDSIDVGQIQGRVLDAARKVGCFAPQVSSLNIILVNQDNQIIHTGWLPAKGILELDMDLYQITFPEQIDTQDG